MTAPIESPDPDLALRRRLAWIRSVVAGAVAVLGPMALPADRSGRAKRKAPAIDQRLTIPLPYPP